MNTQDVQFKLKLPPDVKQWVAVEAAKNMRSQAAEIILAVRAKMAAGDNPGRNNPAAEANASACNAG